MISKFLLRLPSDIKTRLEAEAKVEGVSLNSLIVSNLSGDIRLPRESEVEPLTEEQFSERVKPAAIPAKKEKPQVPGVMSASALAGCGHTDSILGDGIRTCRSCGSVRELNSFIWNQPS